LPVAVVCRTGQSSSEAAKRLHKAGFTRVYWLNDGLNAWVQADLPLTKGR
jgi:rhodanese-related sulfurtransferase